MAFILIIDTALEKGGVSAFIGNNCIGTLLNNEQKEHASFVQTAIEKLITSNHFKLEDIDAIAVVNGPGSYTGLRVGLATAKGLAYALDKKIIAIDTLEVLAYASIKASSEEDAFYIPMIDARRNDVFCGVFNNQLEKESEEGVWELTNDICQEFVEKKKVIINGSGYQKAREILNAENIQFSDVNYDFSDINQIAQQKWQNNDFLDVAYSEPNYIKAFYSTAKPLNINK